MFTKKSELGISTLILLAAIILVSGIIFMIFTSSVSHVTQEARSAGMAIRQNIGSAMLPIKVFAEDGSSGNSVDYFYMEIKPPFASDEVKLNDTLLIFGLSNDSREYTYDNTIDCTIKDAANENSTYNSTNDNYFGVQYVNGSAKYTDTITAGELIRICWKSPASVEKDHNAIITFFSQRGYGIRVNLKYTDLITERTIYFFP